MNAEQQRALDLLEKLISAKPEKRVLRSLELLGSPIVSPPHNQRPEEWGGWCDGWALCVQPTLATALDILLTPKVWKESVLDEHEQQIPKLLADGLPKLEKGRPVYRTIQRQTLRWTQGSTFDFKQGYTIHDVPEARSMSWGQALHYLKYTVQIAKASPPFRQQKTRRVIRGPLSSACTVPTRNAQKWNLWMSGQQHRMGLYVF